MCFHCIKITHVAILVQFYSLNKNDVCSARQNHCRLKQFNRQLILKGAAKIGIYPCTENHKGPSCIREYDARYRNRP